MHLASSLIAAGLVDEYRLFVYPVVLGRGHRLFAESETVSALQLIESRSFRSGVVLQRYRSAYPVRRPFAAAAARARCRRRPHLHHHRHRRLARPASRASRQVREIDAEPALHDAAAGGPRGGQNRVASGDLPHSERPQRHSSGITERREPGGARERTSGARGLEERPHVRLPTGALDTRQ
jgi:hypothetical protein